MAEPRITPLNPVRQPPNSLEAEQSLLVPGLRMGYYLCFFGMHALPASVMELLDAQVKAGSQNIQLSPALNELAGKERYLAAELRGRRFDLEARYGLLFAQMAVALSSKNRDEVLKRMVEVLAEGV